MNLAVLRKSRRRLKPGDVFMMPPPDGKYLYGRVIDTNANPLGVGGAVMIYVYSVRTEGRAPIPKLSPKRLLLPPIITNRLPWSRGYFEHLEHRPLQPDECLPLHCFRDFRGRFLDQSGRQLPGPVEPVGEFGLHSFRTIDDEISKALGLPRATE